MNQLAEKLYDIAYSLPSDRDHYLEYHNGVVNNNVVSRIAAVIDEIATARQAIEDAHNDTCSCSSFSLLYDGGCTCMRSLRKSESNAALHEAIVKLLEMK